MKVKSTQGSDPGVLRPPDRPHLLSSALLRHNHKVYLEGARTGILTNREKWGRKQRRGPERKA